MGICLVESQQVVRIHLSALSRVSDRKKTRGLPGCQYFLVCIHMMDVDKRRDLFVHNKKLLSVVLLNTSTQDII